MTAPETTSLSRADGLSVLKELFGENRAEWPPERFRDLFVEPPYFRKLESRRPSFLMGGRGTGKTTALKSLRFNSTFERLEASGRSFGDQEHLGIFIRIDKNKVPVFQGDALPQSTWNKAFAHYFNLLACAELCDLSEWLTIRTGRPVPPGIVAETCADLGIPAAASFPALRQSIRGCISALQLFVNNPERGSNKPIFSIAEAPLCTFALALRDSGMTEDRTIFCCIDEYENLLDDQQAILNTYIKHAEPPLSYKVGLKKSGLRSTRTITDGDPLKNPDDFEEIDIAQEGFQYFAEKVATLRLARARNRGVNVPDNLDAFLRDMSIAQEAGLLGAGDVADTVLEELRPHPELYSSFKQKPPGEVYFLKYWSQSEQTGIVDLARDWLQDESAWKRRINNYGYASLFWLSKGRKGARTRKYYCGARTILALVAGNIRYFLELIDRAIEAETEGEGEEDLAPKQLTLSPLAQTNAAKIVGFQRLEQLEGLAERGVDLKRLVLAIGKVFFELARSPLGRTPEVTAFVVSGAPEECRRVESLLREGATNLAFEITPRTKMGTESEIKDDEYRLHPIFCAFFEISHRRKRRMTFKAADLLLVLEKPSQAISQLMAGLQSDDFELPEQLAFFSSFFDGGKA